MLIGRPLCSFFFGRTGSDHFYIPKHHVVNSLYFIVGFSASYIVKGTDPNVMHNFCPFWHEAFQVALLRVVSLSRSNSDLFSGQENHLGIMGWEMIRLLMQLNLPPSLCPVPARGREARKRNPSNASLPIWVSSDILFYTYTGTHYLNSCSLTNLPFETTKFSVTAPFFARSAFLHCPTGAASFRRPRGRLFIVSLMALAGILSEGSLVLSWFLASGMLMFGAIHPVCRNVLLPLFAKVVRACFGSG